MTQVRFGTAAPIHAPVVDGKRRQQAIALPDGADHVPAEIHFPDSWTFVEMLNGVTDPGRGFWRHVSAEPPLWVSSDNAKLAEVLAEHYGCKVAKFDASVTTLLAPRELAKVSDVHEAIRARADELDGGGS